MTRPAEFFSALLVIPNPGHNKVGDGCEEAICDNGNDIDHLDSLLACTICRTNFRNDSLMSKRDARWLARGSIGDPSRYPSDLLRDVTVKDVVRLLCR